MARSFADLQKVINETQTAKSNKEAGLEAGKNYLLAWHQEYTAAVKQLYVDIAAVNKLKKPGIIQDAAYNRALAEYNKKESNLKAQKSQLDMCIGAFNKLSPTIQITLR